jgi:adenylate cyclase
MFALARKFACISHVHIKWTLLLLIGLIATVQLLHDPSASNNYASYDQMLKQRLWTPPLDPKIVVVDIDEASLSKLNAEFGRWPWPRETLAGALEWLESKGTNAVVFDILFSDLDATHPSSDQAFADAVSQSKNSFFPILRLNPINDGISQIRADQLTGFAQALNDKAPVPTLAVIPLCLMPL